MWRMMVPVGCLLTAGGLVVVPQNARAQNMEMWGAGSESCATAENALLPGPGAVEQWVLGYFTGANTMTTSDHMVGHNTDAAGIMGEIQLECNTNPSESFYAATAHVYYKLQQADR